MVASNLLVDDKLLKGIRLGGPFKSEGKGDLVVAYFFSLEIGDFELK